ncbi:MAG: 50S ribosomal protein L29 [Pseudomonadota bacterium]
MTVSELRQKTSAQLRETLLELRKEQFNLRIQKATDQLKRPHLVKQARRSIARVKTVMNEQRRAAA